MRREVSFFQKETHAARTATKWETMDEADRSNAPVDRSMRDRAAERERDIRLRRFAAIVEWSEDAIIAMDLQGRIVEWNRSAERLFGYRREEAIGRFIEMLMPHDRADDWSKILERVSRGERIAHFETRRKARDGRILDVSLTVSPVRDQEGRIVGAAKIVRDVTADLEARREAEKTRELFLGMLSHDLRNPLNTINVSVHTLKRSSGRADQKALERISNSTDRMARMIDQLLDFTQSRLGGGIPVHPRNADLASVCRTVADEFEALHPGRIRFSAEADLKGCWDGDRLAEALSNLLSNAFKYGDPDASVTIAGRCRDECVVLAVTNEGPEIPAPLQSAIFDPFRARAPGAAARGQGDGARPLHRAADRARSSGRDHPALRRGGNDILGHPAAPGPAADRSSGPDALKRRAR